MTNESEVKTKSCQFCRHLRYDHELTYTRNRWKCVYCIEKVKKGKAAIKRRRERCS